MIVFIVPYRDRENQKIFFNRHMKKIILKGLIEGKDYELMFIHQNDKREFNRGAMRNIGFLVVKSLYPDDYKEITLVFNDIDIMPYKKDYLNYETKDGEIKHYYGTINTLGGIVSIKGKDFEMIDGYPSFWTWGGEDNIIQIRAKKKGLKINRDEFHPFYDKEMLALDHGVNRNMYKSGIKNLTSSHEDDGLSKIKGLKYSKRKEENMSIIDVNEFEVKYKAPNANEMIEVNVKKTKPRLDLSPIKMINIFKKN
jgi:hypothetical protein